ncbi:MAG TPA: hypothetical protein VL403_12005 [Candidatus Kryptonia bacterium]|nr:hypothetical protein [Candidatus Kryptonia bacterium]
MRSSARWLLGWSMLLLALRASAAETIVSGTVSTARTEGSVVRLGFEDSNIPPVVLLLGWLSNFPPAPEQYYLGRAVSVRGSLRSFRGASEIYVRDAADITVLSSSTGGDSATPATSVEVDRLRAQVRALQKRVQELEQGNRTRDE